MADNYLENKMEEHRRAQASGRPAQSYKGAARRPIFNEHFERRRIFVCDGLSERGQAIVRRLSESGARVAFTGADVREGTALAQSCGARFYPVEAVSAPSVSVAIGALGEVWGGVDVIVSPSAEFAGESGSRVIVYESGDYGENSRRHTVIDAPSLTAAELARIILFAALESSDSLAGKRVRVE